MYSVDNNEEMLKVSVAAFISYIMSVERIDREAACEMYGVLCVDTILILKRKNSLLCAAVN